MNQLPLAEVRLKQVDAKVNGVQFQDSTLVIHNPAAGDRRRPPRKYVVELTGYLPQHRINWHATPAVPLVLDAPSCGTFQCNAVVQEAPEAGLPPARTRVRAFILGDHKFTIAEALWAENRN